MTVPLQLKIALLGIIHDHDAPGWRKIASHLTAMDVPRNPDMLEALKDLAAQGYLQREEGEQTDRWSLTEKGRNEWRLLSELQSAVGSRCWGDTLVRDLLLGAPRELPHRVEAA